MIKTAAAQLKSFVERIERLSEKKKSISDDISDVFKEAKSNGFDVAALRSVLKLRKVDTDERNEHLELVETYLQALGDTPIEAAIRATRPSEEAHA